MAKEKSLSIIIKDFNSIKTKSKTPNQIINQIYMWGVKDHMLDLVLEMFNGTNISPYYNEEYSNSDNKQERLDAEIRYSDKAISDLAVIHDYPMITSISNRAQRMIMEQMPNKHWFKIDHIYDSEQGIMVDHRDANKSDAKRIISNLKDMLDMRVEDVKKHRTSSEAKA